MNSLSASKLETDPANHMERPVCFTTRTIPALERNWKIILNYPSYSERSLSSSISKMVSKLIRHFDQEERQTDGAVHWDTIKPVLEKGFRSHGAESFSETQWIVHIYKGSNKVRFEYCDFSENIDVHSCDSRTFRRNNNCFSINGTRVTATRMERIHISQKMFFQHKIYPRTWTCCRKKTIKRERQTVFFPPLNPCGQVPRKFHHCSKWRHDQDAVYWIKLKRAQDLGLQFWQTKSNAKMYIIQYILNASLRLWPEMDKK